METKYYTPTIEEFHVGFEYEYLGDRFNWMHDNPTKGWNKESFEHLVGDDGDSMSGEVRSMIESDRVRVKHLDQEDIESEGWGLKPEGCFGQSDDGEELFTFYIKEEYTMLHTSENILRVFKSNQIGQLACLFNGTIKNKSELKQVLKMIGI